MARRRGRIAARIVLMLAIVLFAGGAFFIVYGVRWYAKFDRWLIDEPVRLRVDLSLPGTVEAPFVQTCAIAHAQSVELRPVYPEDKHRLGEAAAVSEMSVRLYTPGGLRNLAIAEPPLAAPEGSDAVPVFRLRPVPDGVYRFVVRTEKPADFRPLPAFVCVRNELCGLERMPGTIAVGVGIGLGFFGLVSAGVAMALRGSGRRAVESIPISPPQSP